MRYLFVAFYKVFPPSSGAAAVTYSIAKFFPGQKKLIYIDSSSREMQLDEQLEIRTLSCSARNNILKALRIFMSLPSLARIIKKYRPHWVVLEGSSWTGYFLMLLLFLKTFRIRSRIIYHAHNVEVLLRKEKNSALLAWLTGITEKLVVHNSDVVTAVSKVDIRNMKSLYGIRPQFLPNGVDLLRYRVARSEINLIKAKYGLGGEIVLFMGLPEYTPNKEAIDFLLKEVFPLLLNTEPKVRLAIIGGKIGNAYPWLINPGSIPFTDVPAFIKNCTICVAPIFSGSGTRIKILEYMASRKPVLATAKGAEGLQIKDGENILLAENAIDFSRKIVGLLDDCRLRSSIANKGFQVVKAHYSWTNIVHTFINLPPFHNAEY